MPDASGPVACSSSYVLSIVCRYYFDKDWMLMSMVVHCCDTYMCQTDGVGPRICARLMGWDRGSCSPQAMPAFWCRWSVLFCDLLLDRWLWLGQVQRVTPALQTVKPWRRKWQSYQRDQVRLCCWQCSQSIELSVCYFDISFFFFQF